MNINKISPMLSFNGLWGDKYYLGRSYRSNVSVYEKPYYPFADETEAEIVKATDEGIRKLGHSPKYSYVIAKVMSKLSMTKAEFKQIIEGKMPDSLLTLENLKKIIPVSKL